MNLRLLLFVCTMPILIMGNLRPELTAFYKNSDVIELSNLNFNKLVLESNDAWIVQFYAECCPASKEVVTQYKKLATSFKGRNIHTGAINCEKDHPFCNRLEIKSFPTFKLYGSDKSASITYVANDTDYIESIEKFISDQLKNETQEMSTLKDAYCVNSSTSLNQTESATTEVWTSSESAIPSQQLKKETQEMSTLKDDFNSSASVNQTESETTEVWTSSESAIPSQQLKNETQEMSTLIDDYDYGFSSSTSVNQTESETTEVWTSSESAIPNQQLKNETQEMSTLKDDYDFSCNASVNQIESETTTTSSKKALPSQPLLDVKDSGVSDKELSILLVLFITIMQSAVLVCSFIGI